MRRLLVAALAVPVVASVASGAPKNPGSVTPPHSDWGLVHDFPVENVRGAALSGNRLALRVGGGVSVYDTSSGEVVFRAEGGDRLEDLQSGILVTTSGKTVKLRRVEDGRVARIRTRGVSRAQLERPGLFVAGGRRVTFTPMADVLRRLG